MSSLRRSSDPRARPSGVSDLWQQSWLFDGRRKGRPTRKSLTLIFREGDGLHEYRQPPRIIRVTKALGGWRYVLPVRALPRPIASDDRVTILLNGWHEDLSETDNLACFQA